jgi:hypothetical protein
MTSLVRRISYHGYLLDEFVGVSARPLEVDLAVFMAGWERRTEKIARDNFLRPKQAIVLRFNDENMVVHPGELLSQQRIPWRNVELASHYDIRQSISRIVDVFQEQASEKKIESIFLDVTCMPKLLIQWLVMEIMRTKLVGCIYIGYVSGDYSSATQEPDYDQGVRDFITIPHSIGDGGASVRKACIAALGADERLLSHYFENESSFDRHFLLASSATGSEKIQKAVRLQIDSLAARYQMDKNDISEVSPTSIIEAILSFDKFVQSAANCDSWEIFCTGPKTQAVASCFVSLRHRNVRLIGRVPKEYDQKNVGPGEAMCLFRAIDLTDPRIARFRGLDRPLGSSEYTFA